MDFRHIVKKRMAEKNIKVAELARLTGYTSRHIYDLLSDRNCARWNETNFARIFGVLGLELDVKAVEQKTGTNG